jgi:hypothetical protein
MRGNRGGRPHESAAASSGLEEGGPEKGRGLFGQIGATVKGRSGTPLRGKSALKTARWKFGNFIVSRS